MLGRALQQSDGHYDAAALPWLFAATAAVLGSVLAPTPRPLDRRGGHLLVAVIVIGLAWQFTLLLRAPPGHLLPPGTDLGLFNAGVVVAALIVAGGMSGAAWVRRVRLPALLVLHFLLGLWLIHAIPDPRIDVLILQRDGIAALFSGQSPYAIRIEDIYDPRGGLTDFGYPYPPASLFMVVPGYLFGDVRYAHLAAVVLTGALIGGLRPGRIAFSAAALFLFTPRVFMVLEKSWTEPLLALLLAATAFLAVRHSGRTASAFGLLIALKQYMVFVAPLMLLLAPRPSDLSKVRFAAEAAVVLALVSVPLIALDVPAFYHSAVAFLLDVPPRPDALSIPAWLGHHGGPEVPVWLTVAVTSAVALGVGLLARPGAASFALGSALVLLVFFLLNKQAFANYYFLTIAALCVVVAAWSPPNGAHAATPVATGG